MYVFRKVNPGYGVNLKVMVLLGVFLISLNLAAWQKDGVPIVTGPGDQTDPKVIAPEGKNYFYVVWSEIPGSSRRVVVGKFDVATGEPLWSTPFIVADTGRNQWYHQAVATPSGNLIITFQANFASTGGVYTIYATKIRPEKTWGYPSKWVKVGSAAGDGYYPQFCLDSSGEGCYVTWEDYRSGNPDVWTARVTSQGQVSWTAPVCSLAAERWNPDILPSAKGAIVFWGGKEYDTVGVYGNRIVGDSFLWGKRGKLILPYSSGVRLLDSGLYPSPYVATDGTGGAYVFPADWLQQGVQRVDNLGRLLFDSIPKVGSPYGLTPTADNGVVAYYPFYAMPGNWYQYVNGVKVDSSGALPWGDSSRIWTSSIWDTTTDYTPYSSLAGDHHKGCVTAIGGWQTKEEDDIIVIHTDSSGHSEAPIVVCGAPGDQKNPVIIQEPTTKGYIIAWEDYRNGNSDIYAQYIDSTGQVGIGETARRTPIPKDSLLSIEPNPFNRTATIKYALSVKTKVSLKIYNATGRLVRTLVDGEQESGIHTVNWDGTDDKDQRSAAGVYFYRLESKEYKSTKKVVKLK